MDMNLHPWLKAFRYILDLISINIEYRVIRQLKSQRFEI